MNSAPLIPADAVKVRMEEPVLIDQAPPSVKVWGPYRMPKLFRMPDGEVATTFAVGLDLFRGQGDASPLFTSPDQGATWRRTTVPHPRMRGMNPFMASVFDGEYFCLPARAGLAVKAADLSPATIRAQDGYGEPMLLCRLDDCSPPVAQWMRDLPAVRWSPTTRTWTEEPVAWDHRDQMVFFHRDWMTKDESTWYTQKAYIEVPPLRVGKELLHVDYWTMRAGPDGKAPATWTNSLMVSTDNGRRWQYRGNVVESYTPGGSLAQAGEPTLARNRQGELVCVLRRDPCFKPMIITRSQDLGRTWSVPEVLFDRGVFPNLLQLENGVMVLSFGRPGVWLSFSLDGGQAWTQPRAIIEADVNDDEKKHSCGYTSLLALGRDSFLLAYGDFNLPNPQGEPCKSILVRRISVAPAG